MKDDINKLKQQKSVLEADLSIALNALRFYGNQFNWQVTRRLSALDRTSYFTSDVADDNGQRARITVDTILKVRKHHKQIEDSRHSYNDMQLSVMGYQIMPFGDGFIIAKKPEEVLGLFTFTGIGLSFGIDIATLKPFPKDTLARVAISNYINKQALMIKHKPKDE